MRTPLKSRKIKILLIDDRNENLLALEQLLQSDELILLKARSGMEALNTLIDHDIALALIDVQMPGMNGFELAELMRGIERTKSIPIIFVTAADRSQQNTFKGYESGAVDFLYKPLDPFIVKSKVQVFVELYAQKQTLQWQLSELNQTLKSLKQTEAELKRAVQARDEFLSIASHELKTPLTPMKIQLELLTRMARRHPDEGIPSDEVIAGAVQIDSQLHRLSVLVDSLFDVTEISKGKLSLRPEELDFSELSLAVAERQKPALNAAGCELTVSVAPNLTILADRARMEQLVSSLLDNAAKHAFGRPVEVHLHRRQNRIHLEVADQGTGISPEHQSRIFQRFERAANSKHVSGLGLGLYVASRIVEAHKGSISVESHPGKGSRFIVELPALEIERSAQPPESEIS